MRLRLAYVPLALLTLAACTEDIEPADSRARVDYLGDTLVTESSVYVTLDDGGTVWDFGPGNFERVAPASSLFVGPEVQTRAAGDLQMTFELVDGGGTPFSDGSLTAPLSPNWRWSFEIVHAGDSIYACSDCVTATRYAIYDPAHADEYIHILWRGRGP